MLQQNSLMKFDTLHAFESGLRYKPGLCCMFSATCCNLGLFVAVHPDVGNYYYVIMSFNPGTSEDGTGESINTLS